MDVQNYAYLVLDKCLIKNLLKRKKLHIIKENRKEHYVKLYITLEREIRIFFTIEYFAEYFS